MDSKKDLYDLISEFIQSSGYRDTVAKAVEIQAFVTSLQALKLAAEKENLELRKRIAELEQELSREIGAKGRLENEIAGLDKRHRELRRNFEKLQRKAADLQSRLLKWENRFSYDNRMKFPQDESGQLYCPKCLAKEQIESRLVAVEFGWQCNICDKFFMDPDVPEEGEAFDKSELGEANVSVEGE